MPATRAEWAVFVLLTAGGGVLVGLAAWTWWSDYRETPHVVSLATPPTVAAPPTTRASFVPRAQPPRRVRLVIAATRGDCWLAIRRGSATGAVVSERVLARGETLRVSGRRLWVRLGAAANVDVTVDGASRPVSPGTSNFVATAS